MPEECRRIESYRDAAGRSDVERELARLMREDQRAYKAVQARIDLLKRMHLADMIRLGIVKHATSHIFVLRVQSGSVAYRLPFFEAPNQARTLVITTHCVHRSVLRGDRYKRLITDAEKRRDDWIRRHATGGSS